MGSIWDEEEEQEEQDPADAEVIDAEVTDVQPADDGSANNGGNLPASGGENSLVKPVDDIGEVVEVYEQFEEIKKRLLSKSDVTKIGDNNHINKSGWRKIATAFGLSVDVLSKKRSVEDGIVTYTVTARAVAPNGKTSTGSGMCASNESNHMETVSESDDWSKDDDDVFKVDGKWRRIKPVKAVNEHNIMATAETRAKNRAISDMVGGGQVSAEEMKSKILE